MPKKGGLEFVIHNLAKNLAAQGHNIYVFTSRASDGFDDRMQNYNIVRYACQLRGLGRLRVKPIVDNILLIYHFWQIHGVKKFDIINTHSAFNASSDGLCLSKIFRLPCIITCHGDDVQFDRVIGYGLRLSPKYDNIIINNLQKADKVVAISNYMEKLLSKIIDRKKVVKIPNGVNLNNNYNLQKKFAQRNNSNDKQQILLVGRNTPVKGFDDSLLAFSHICKKNPNTNLLHIGRNGNSLVKLAEKLGFGHQFHSVNEIDQDMLLHYYLSSDIFLSSSLLEASSLVCLEAMSWGLPCVVTNSGGISEMVIHGFNGMVVPVGDIACIANALDVLLQNNDIRISYGLKSIELVHKYDWVNVAKKYQNLFYDVQR